MFPSAPATELLLTPQLAEPVAGRLSPAPYSFQFTHADALRLTVHNSQSGVEVAVHYRLLTQDAGILATVYRATPATDRTATAFEFVIGEGYLLNATVFASSGSPRRGQTFVRLQAIHGRTLSATVLGTIVQGYVTGQQDRAWPGSPLEGSLEGDGYTRTLSGTDPAAGTSIQETVPTGARWRVRAAKTQLATSATVATRKVYAQQLVPGAFAVAWSWQTLAQVASETNDYFWALGLPVEATPPSNKGVAGLPDIVLLAGSTFVIGAISLQPGDDFNTPQLTLDEWVEAQ